MAMAACYCNAGLMPLARKDPTLKLIGQVLKWHRNSSAFVGSACFKPSTLTRSWSYPVISLKVRGKKHHRRWVETLCRSSDLQNLVCRESIIEDFKSFGIDYDGMKLTQGTVFQEVKANLFVPGSIVAAFSALIVPSDSASASTLNPTFGEVGALLEAGVQLIYLGALLVLLGVGSFLVVRQVLIKRELETAAKDLQERVRSGEATSLEYFELGAVMLRKKYYPLANKYLDQAIKKWDGSEQDLAQVYNALGFSYFSDGKEEKAIAQYERAVQLQPGYVVAWNNLGDAYEKQKQYSKALKAYERTLQLEPSNKIASARKDYVKSKVDRYQGIP